MRRRSPRLIHLSPEEVRYLEGLVRDGRTEQRIARRARILLEIDDSATIVSELADRLGQNRRTIWALCRRFEALGVDVVKDSYRPGDRGSVPPSSASKWSAWRAVNRLGSGLVHVQPSACRSTAGHCSRHLPLHGGRHPSRCRPATAPLSLLEDTDSRRRLLRHEAAQILWCYEQARKLAERGEVVLCLDEKPTFTSSGFGSAPA